MPSVRPLALLYALKVSFTDGEYDAVFLFSFHDSRRMTSMLRESLMQVYIFPHCQRGLSLAMPPLTSKDLLLEMDS